MKTNLLKSKMVLHGDTLTTLAEILNTTVRTCWCRVNGKTSFKPEDIKKIKERYSLSDSEVADIFFS